MSRVEVIHPVIIVAVAETEQEADAKVMAFLDTHEWREDADLFVSRGRTDLSLS